MSGDEFDAVWQSARRESLRGGFGTLALLLSMSCPVLIVYCFNSGTPYYTAHHADAEVVNIWDPWRQPEPWHEDGLLRCTWLEETNRTCPALKSIGTTERSLTGMRTIALFVYPVAAAARPIVIGCAFAGVLKESWLCALQAAVGMFSALVLAVLFDLAPPVLEGYGTDGWVVVCALPSVVWLAVRVEFIFCLAQVTLVRHFQHAWLFFWLMFLVMLIILVPVFLTAISLGAGVSYGWLHLVPIPPQVASFFFILSNDDKGISPFPKGMVLVMLELAFCTVVYYAFYDSHFRSFVMDTTWVCMAPGMRVLFPVTVPVLLLASLGYGGDSEPPTATDYGYEHHRRRDSCGPPACYDNLPEEASGYESCPECTDVEAAPCDAADGVLLHLRLPNGVLVLVELGSDATLGVLRLRAADALRVGHMEVRVRLALCGDTIAGCNTTQLRDVGLEADAIVDVHTKPRAEPSDPSHLMDLACRDDDVQAARRVLGGLPCPTSVEDMLSALVINYRRDGCHNVLRCALLEGNLTSAAVVIRELLESQEPICRVLQESGVLDRPGVYDAFEDSLGFSDRYTTLACACPGFLESTACNHYYIILQTLGHGPFDGDYTALCSRLHERGWRPTPSAVQQACLSQVFRVDLFTRVLLTDGVRVRDLPHVVRFLCGVALTLLLTLAVIAVHAVYGTRGADPVGGWLFVAFLCVASVTIAVELLPEWVWWLVGVSCLCTSARATPEREMSLLTSSDAEGAQQTGFGLRVHDEC